ncbi:MAG: hypothetical protein AB7U98_08130 [Candidatus Nitrosocosmicus sp.]|jgi:hypothetical protein
MRKDISNIEFDQRKTITMTFRIEKDILEELRDEARIKGTSLNMLVNSIFKDFVYWYAFDAKIGMVPLPKTVILNLFRSLRKDEIIDIATRIGKIEIYDIALFMKSKVDVDSFMEWVDTRMRNSSMHMTHMVDNNLHIYTIKHNLCLNWSLHHKIILELIFEEFIGKDVEINISETAFTIKFEKKVNFK